MSLLSRQTSVWSGPGTSAGALTAAGRIVMVRVLGRVAVLLSITLGSAVFFMPTADAAMVVPMVAAIPCGPAQGTLCIAEQPEFVAALAEQGMTQVSGAAAATPALSASESAAFDGITANYGATAATSTADSAAAIGSAPPAGWSWQSAWGWAQSGFGLVSGGAAISNFLSGQGATLTDPAAIPSGSTASSGGWSGPMAYTNRFTGSQTPPTTVANFNEVMTTTGIDASGFHATVTATQGPNEIGGGAFSAPNPTMVFYKGATPGTSPCGSTGVMTLGYTQTGNVFNYSGDMSVIGTAYGQTCSSSTAGGWTDVTSFTLQFNQVGFPVLTFTKTAAPSRYVETSITCSNGVSYKSMGPAVTSTAAGAFFKVAAVMCPSTAVMQSATETLKTQGGADLPLSTATTGPTIRSVSPGCYAAGAACVLRLSVLRSGTSATWDSCFTQGNACAGWWEQPQALRSTQYKCEFGTGTTWTVVNVYACSVYARTFDVTNPTINTPEKPITSSSSGSCDLGWSSVLDGTIMQKAVSCALAWAFVPDPAVVQQMVGDLKTTFDQTAPAVIVNEAVTVTLPFRNMSSDPETQCLGPEVDWGWGFLPHAHPFATCDGFTHDLAAYFRPILGAVLLLLAFGEGVRTLAHTIELEVSDSV